MFVYTIQSVVQPVVKPVLQPLGQLVVSCIQTFNQLFIWLYEFNMFDSCSPTFDHSHAAGCSTGLTTGCIV